MDNRRFASRRQGYWVYESRRQLIDSMSDLEALCKCFGMRMPLCSSLHTGTSGLAFHSAQPTAIAILTAPASHNAADIPTLLRLSHPPIMPPRSRVTAEATRLFLLTLSFASMCGSLIRSQNRLVNTVVGTSLIPRILLVTICPPLWNARNAMGSNSMKWTPEESSSWNPEGEGTTCRWTNAAAMNIRMAWRKNEAASVSRRSGWVCRERAKKKQPIRKKTMAVKDLSQL